jgi:hypothetical protein
VLLLLLVLVLVSCHDVESLVVSFLFCVFWPHEKEEQLPLVVGFCVGCCVVGAV